MDFKLELVIIPVSDVDASKAFYTERVGFAEHVDFTTGPEFRVVQLDPPGSSCSITIGVGLTDTEPGTYRGMHLVVSDLEAACAELAGRGVEVDPIFHFGENGKTDGPDPGRADFGSFSGFADPDGNVWVLQEVGYAGAEQ